MVHITTVVMEKVQFNHFPIISLWELSVAMATKPRGRSHSFCYFALLLPKQHLYQISHSASVVLKLSFKYSFFKIECCHGNQTKWPLVIKQISWVDNHQMNITAKYGSHHLWLWRKCNLTISPLEVHGSFLLPRQPNLQADHHNFS